MFGIAATLLVLGAIAVASFAAVAVTLQLPPGWLVHAGLMLLAWGVLIPGGALIARFFKVLPGQDWPRVLDNKTWWRAHLGLQYLGVATMSAGVAVMVWANGLSLDSGHARIGLGAVALGWVQVVGGLLRGSKGGPTEAVMRGDHYDMTRRRRVFEAMHKLAGWFSLLVATIAMQTGLAVIAVPLWLHGLALLSLIAVATAFAVCTARGMRVATHAAIWGPSASTALEQDRVQDRARWETGAIRGQDA